MPITILEAMSLGKIVITADVGGIAEWVRDEMNGLLVPRENPDALARAIERCLTDKPLAARLRAAAQRTFNRHFTLERFATHFASLLENVPPKNPPRERSIATGYYDWMLQYDTVDTVSLQRELRCS